MLPAPTYVISDLHLGFATPTVQRDVLAFLRHLQTAAGALVINGDLFEFWFEWKSVVPRSSVRVLAALADLRGAGVPVLMIAGNHDCWGGSVLREDIGIDYRFGPWNGSVAGWNTLIDHGDGLRPVEDRRYRGLRRVLRNPLAIRTFRWLHPDLGTALATRSSHASRVTAARDGGAGLAAVAARAVEMDPSVDLVIFGHSHVPTVQRAGRGIYANAGSWLTAPTYLRITPERVAMREWRSSAESADLHALDRPGEKTLAQL